MTCHAGLIVLLKKGPTKGISMRFEEHSPNLPLHVNSELLHHESDNLFCQGMNDPVVYFAAFAFSCDDSLVFEKGEMRGNCCLGKSEEFPYMFYVALLGAEAGNNLQTHGMTKHFVDFSLVIKIAIFIEFHS
jgi:hypothetical protein